MKFHVINELDDLSKLLHCHEEGMNQRLGELLRRAGMVSEAHLSQALRQQKLVTRRRLGQILVENGWVAQEIVNLAMAYKLGIPAVAIKDFSFKKQSVTCLPKGVVKKYRIMPLGEINGRLVVASDCPFDGNLLENLRFHVDRPIDVVYAASEEIEVQCQRYLGGVHEADALLEVSRESSRKAVTKIEQAALEKPIVQLVSNIIGQAVDSLASDINIRPGAKCVSIYYRLDGKMTHIRDLSPELLPALVSRIKILGAMDIAERRLPQDGHAIFPIDGKSVDLRISVVPTLRGESVVIRVLDKRMGLMSLQGLGLSGQGVSILKNNLQRHQGMMVVTGPTGAGKSTTLYALVNQARQNKERHILTIEDPVEYEVEGVEQVQVMPKRNFGFAEALRQFLRHDPDVIMVGEMRDDETAQIANKAALTGHVVLTTLHTRDAVSTVQRLYNMGIEPYLLASTLSCVVAQRLVRKVCPHCAVDDENVPADVDGKFLKGQGCYQCHRTGYSGRISVAEILDITPEIADAIAARAQRSQLLALAEQQGMQRMYDVGLKLAAQGITTLEEVMTIRVD